MIKRKVFLTILLTLILIVSGAAAVRAESGPLSESEITDILNEMKPVSDTYGQASAMMFFTGDTDSEIDVSCGQEKFWDLIHIYAFYMQHYYYDLNGSVPDLFLSWDDCKVIAGHLFKDFNGTLPDNAESYPFEVREDGVKPIFSQLETFDLNLLEASSDPSGFITAAYELVWQPYYTDSPSWQISFRFVPNENYNPSDKYSLSYRIDAAAIGSV